MEKQNDLLKAVEQVLKYMEKTMKLTQIEALVVSHHVYDTLHYNSIKDSLKEEIKKELKK